MTEPATLDPARRARTVVASVVEVQVTTGTDTTRVPCLDLDGAPLLVVPTSAAATICRARRSGLRLGRADGLGTVVLTGTLTPVAADLLPPGTQQAVAAASRGRGPVTLLQLVVETALIDRPEEATEPAPLDLDDYWSAIPHEVLARGWQLARHLNAAHRADLRALAAGLRDVPADAVAGAEVTIVDPDGFDLRLVDRHGGWTYRVSFAHRCDLLAEVADQLASLVASYADR